MGVDVDEARRHEPTFGVDLAAARLLDTTVVGVDDRRDHVTGDGDVGDATRRPGAVHHGAVPNDDVRSHVPPLNVRTSHNAAVSSAADMSAAKSDP